MRRRRKKARVGREGEEKKRRRRKRRRRGWRGGEKQKKCGKEKEYSEECCGLKLVCCNPNSHCDGIRRWAPGEVTRS